MTFLPRIFRTVDLDNGRDDHGGGDWPASRGTFRFPALHSVYHHHAYPRASDRPVGPSPDVARSPFLSNLEAHSAHAFLSSYYSLQHTLTSPEFGVHLARTMKGPDAIDATFDLVDAHLVHAGDRFHRDHRLTMARALTYGVEEVASGPDEVMTKAGASGAARRRYRPVYVPRDQAQPQRRSFPDPASRPAHLRHLGSTAEHLQAAHQISASLVVDVTRTQRGRIRGAIVQAIRDGVTVDNTGWRIASFVGLFPRWQAAVDNFHAGMIARGVPTAQASQRAADYARQLIARRGMMIARTELMRALNTGRLMGYQGMADAGLIDAAQSVKEWHAASGACDMCDDMDDGESPVRVRGLSTPFITELGPVQAPPLHPHCFPAGTIVSGPRPHASTERWYSGEIVEIVTSSGQILTATPNHPVLTDQGWVASGEVMEGDQLVRQRDPQRPLVGNPADHQQPACIEDVTGTLNDAGSMATSSVPMSDVDFHGDGTKGQVCVVRTDGLLRGDNNTSVNEHGRDQGLSGRRTTQRLDGQGDALTMDDRMLVPSDSIMGGSGVDSVLLGGATRHHEPVGFQSVASGHAGLDEETLDGRAADASDFAQRLLAHPSLITTDQVVRVSRRPFSGHVYNLQTGPGWYLANGYVVHNCRCTLIIHPARIDRHDQVQVPRLDLNAYPVPLWDDDRLSAEMDKV